MKDEITTTSAENGLALDRVCMLIMWWVRATYNVKVRACLNKKVWKEKNHPERGGGGTM